MNLFGGKDRAAVQAERRAWLLAAIEDCEALEAGGVKFTKRQIAVLQNCVRDLELCEHERDIATAKAEALEAKVAVLEETIGVLRDALAAHQVTNRLHAAEGQVLIREVSNK